VNCGYEHDPATLSSGSNIRNPTPMTRPYPFCAAVRRFGSRALAELVMYARPWALSCFSPRWRRTYDRCLTPLSFRPPMSVTTAALTVVAPDFDGAAVAESAMASITANAARPTDAEGKTFLTCTESSSFFEVFLATEGRKGRC